ncbi:MAG: family 78 glycoside hydrolase catalytic domain, partial [Clostridia bacterium]|nr:family 78 glycoside hydrolase catalytic domain [Clostridia bacterium]
AEIIKLKISADSNYAVYINGELAVFGQYADFPYDKIYDEVDISKYCKKGNNHVAVVVWYFGITTTSVYYKGEASLIFEIVNGDRVLCFSGEHTPSRLSRTYGQHARKIITGQMGLSFSYDITKDDGWKTGELDGFASSVIVSKHPSCRIRPCEKLVLEEKVLGKEIKRISENDIIFELGSEQVGFVSLDITSDTEQDIMVVYGEHIADGNVRYIIGSRDFSFKLRLRKGENRYLNPFRRLGARYLEIKSEKPITVNEAAIAPTMYPVALKAKPKLNEYRSQIYDICVNTLRLCMHEHYEDCPWREQALYCMDSRNQMLCGYYAFGEYKFPRSCLELISKDDRKDRLLSICYPINNDFCIPSFSMHYITECREYLQYSGDKAFIEEIYPKLESVLSAFLERRENGLMPIFEGKQYWNFYEWSFGLDGYGKGYELPKFDLLINALISIALENMGKIGDMLGKPNGYRDMIPEINRRIREEFWDEKKGLFADCPDKARYSVLGNSLAILCGAAEDRKGVCDRMLNLVGVTDISLSMRCFKYDAMLMADKEKYADYILSEIDENYRPMLELGNGTVWETDAGEKDFGKAGSLCHGWSAMPIYYYNILN